MIFRKQSHERLFKALLEKENMKKRLILVLSLILMIWPAACGLQPETTAVPPVTQETTAPSSGEAPSTSAPTTPAAFALT